MLPQWGEEAVQGQERTNGRDHREQGLALRAGDSACHHQADRKTSRLREIKLGTVVPQ